MIYRSRCREHAAAYERRFRSSNAPIYKSRRWRILRRHILARNPICAMCDERLAEHVDHKVDIEAGGPIWAPSNLQALCAVCHGRKTRLLS